MSIMPASMGRLRKSLKNLPRFFLLILIIQHFSCTFVIRTPFDPPKNEKLNLYRGVYHVHSEFSHDSKASLEDIVETAKKAGLDFVVITDHNNMGALQSLRNSHDTRQAQDPLLIVGIEISTWHDGHLGVMGVPEAPPELEHTKDLIDFVHRQGGYAIPAHSFSLKKPWTNWELGYDGMEVFCFSDFFYEQKWYELVSKSFLLSAEDFLKSVVSVNPEYLKRWDEKLSGGRHIAGFGAVDAHVKFRLGNFIPENLLMSFQSVTTYVWADEKNESKMIEALAKGKSFIAFEVFGLADGFSFSASKGGQTFEAGDTVFIDQVPVELNIKLPKAAHIKLIHNGTVAAEHEGSALTYHVNQAGFYRTEIYLGDKTWILSNPIYVETLSPSS